MNREWVEKDFYKTLGIPKDSPPEEIKRAYRRLAQKLHPDANPGDAAAEEKFKQVSEAYSVLGDPKQREEYDQVRRLSEGGFGSTWRVGGPDDLTDIFAGFGGMGDVISGFGQARAGGPQKGADSTATINISFEDAIRGVTTDVQVRGEASCSRCHGNGGEPGTVVKTCPACGGTGHIAQNQGLFAFPITCQTCNGQGRTIEQPCTRCHGSGREVKSRSIRLKIPAGVRNNSTVRLRDKGMPGVNGGPPGDLLVTIKVAEHPVFGRSGNNLTVTVPISFSEATLGTKLDIPTLEGKVTLRIPPATPSGKTFRVRSLGVTPTRGRRGDLLVKVEVVVPEKLSRDEKRLITQLAEVQNGDIRADLWQRAGKAGV